MEISKTRKEIENNGLIIISIAAVLIYWFFDSLLSGVVFVRLLTASLIITYGTFTQYLINSHKAVQSELKKVHNGMEEQVKMRTADLLRANEALTGSERLFHTLAQVSPVGIFHTDAQGDLIYVNDRWREIAGMPMEKALGKNWAEAIHSEERDRVIRKWYESVRANRPFNLEYQFHRPDGSSMWVLGQATAEISDNGEISGYVGTITDITERKRAEDRLRESERRYRELFENMWSGVSVYETRNNGEDFIFKDYNAAAEMLDKTPREQAIGRSVVDVFPGVKDFGLFDVFQRVYRTGKSERHPLTLYKDKKISGWRENYVYKLPSGEIVAVFEDITEYKQAEEKLGESEENFRRSLDESPLGVRIVTIEGETIYANRAILDIYGYDSLEELRTTFLKKRYTPESYAEYQIRMGKRKRGDYYPSEYDISIVRKDGEVRHLHVFRKEVLWGGERQFQVLYNDITEREKQRKKIEYLASFPLLAPIMIFEVSKGREVIFCNPSMQSFLDKMGTDDPCIFIPKDIWKLYNSTDKTMKREYVRELQINDIIFLENIYFTPEFNSLRVYATDVTEHRKAEVALWKSEEKYRHIVENAREGIYRSTPGGRFISANQAMATIFDYDSPVELMATVTDIENQLYVHPENRQEIIKIAQEKGFVSEYEYQLYRKDRSVMWASTTFNIVRDTDGTTLYLEGFLVDITERKQAEETLRESQEIYKTLAEKSMAGVYVVQDGKFRFINSNAASYAGYTKEGLLDQKADLIVSPEDKEKLRQNAKAMLRGEMSTPYEYRIITKQGKTRWIMETITSILYEGRPAILGNSMDITERKRAEEAIKASHHQLRDLAGRLQTVREEQKKEIAREIHDQFGGAMAGLKIDLSFLASSAPKSWHITKRDSFLSKVREMSKLIDETIGTVRRLVTELRPSILDDFGLLAALEWQLWEFQKRTGIQSEFVSTLEDLNIAEKLSITVFRIFQEALTNVARHANATKVTATLYKEADSLVLKVEDNGKGISADDIHNTNSFGLMGMRERALFLGGTVDFSGEPSKGTTVSVRFQFWS